MKGSLIVILSLCLVSFKPPGEADYKKVFGERYTWAVNWLKQNDAVIQEYALAFGIPAKELKSIVFPELIRYNSLSNAIEIESLKYFYVQEGKDYADFSVGFFQMKPSFGEMVENDARALLPADYLLTSGWGAEQVDDEESRRARVKRLSNTRHQLIYLCAFYKICDKRFKGWNFKSVEEKLKLFATCYNAGYKRSFDALIALSAKNNFYSFNYSSISTYYYRQE